MKYAELLFLLILTGLITGSTLSFIDTITSQAELEDKDIQCIAFAIISFVIAIYNLFFNNLFLNIRFYAKMKSITLGKCIFDAFNTCFCYRFLKKPCRDKCFTPWTIAKWITKLFILGYTISLVQWKVDKWEESFEVGAVDDVSTSNLDTYLIVYLLQHPIFLVARIPILLIYMVVTCYCDTG